MNIIWSFIKGVGQVIYFMVMRVVTYPQARKIKKEMR